MPHEHSVDGVDYEVVDQFEGVGVEGLAELLRKTQSVTAFCPEGPGSGQFLSGRTMASGRTDPRNTLRVSRVPGFVCGSPVSTISCDIARSVSRGAGCKREERLSATVYSDSPAASRGLPSALPSQHRADDSLPGVARRLSPPVVRGRRGPTWSLTRGQKRSQWGRPGLKVAELCLAGGPLEVVGASDDVERIVGPPPGAPYSMSPEPHDLHR